MKLVVFLCGGLFFPSLSAAIYDSYPYPDTSSYGTNTFNPLASLFNPFLSSQFSWPQYGTVTPWSNGGLFGLTRATGHSDRYGGNLGYNYGCIPFCKYGGSGLFPPFKK